MLCGMITERDCGEQGVKIVTFNGAYYVSCAGLYNCTCVHKTQCGGLFRGLCQWKVMCLL